MKTSNGSYYPLLIVRCVAKESLVEVALNYDIRDSDAPDVTIDFGEGELALDPRRIDPMSDEVVFDEPAELIRKITDSRQIVVRVDRQSMPFVVSGFEEASRELRSQCEIE